MRWWMLAVPLVAFSACKNQCLEGSYVASFEGHKTGTIDFTFGKPNGGEAPVDLTLESDGGSLSGTGDGTALCRDGTFTARIINDRDGEDFGELGGIFVDDGAEGTWALTTGDNGTFSF